MYILKFVLHSWWRNKLFVTISLVSLVIGIACTNLLTAFVLYEYNIEYNNPNRDRILRLTQTLPFAQQEMQGTFVYHESVPEIISQFPEIEASLRTQAITHTKIRVGDQEYSELNLLSADSTLPVQPFRLSLMNLTRKKNGQVNFRFEKRKRAAPEA